MHFSVSTAEHGTFKVELKDDSTTVLSLKTVMQEKLPERGEKIGVERMTFFLGGKKLVDADIVDIEMLSHVNSIGLSIMPLEKEISSPVVPQQSQLQPSTSTAVPPPLPNLYKHFLKEACGELIPVDIRKAKTIGDVKSAICASLLADKGRNEDVKKLKICLDGRVLSDDEDIKLATVTGCVFAFPPKVIKRERPLAEPIRQPSADSTQSFTSTAMPLPASQASYPIPSAPPAPPNLLYYATNAPGISPDFPVYEGKGPYYATNAPGMSSDFLVYDGQDPSTSTQKSLPQPFTSTAMPQQRPLQRSSVRAMSLTSATSPVSSPITSTQPMFLPPPPPPPRQPLPGNFAQQKSSPSQPARTNINKMLSDFAESVGKLEEAFERNDNDKEARLSNLKSLFGITSKSLETSHADTADFLRQISDELAPEIGTKGLGFIKNAILKKSRSLTQAKGLTR